jgi:ABC-2 type transport system permease protein
VIALWRVFVKELLQLRQDKKMIPVLVVGPVIQLLALSYAANLDVANIPLAVVDQDHSASSRALLDRFTSSRWFDTTVVLDDVRDAEPLLHKGDAQVVLVIPPAYEADLARGARPTVQVFADGSDSNSAGVGLGYAGRIVGEAGADLLPMPPAGARRARVELAPRVFYNPDLRSRWFYVPAVLAMVLLLVTMILPSMAIVREKEGGQLEQLIVTPLGSGELMLGKLLPFVVIGLVDLHLVTAVAVYLFGVPLRGSFLLLVGVTLLFLMVTLGLGLLVSTLVRTQQQAMLASMFLLMVPMIYLSGLIFPIENMPRPIQLVTYAIPLRYYAVVLRGIFLRGVGLEVLWPQALALLVFGVSVLTLAALRFRKTLD